MIARHINGFFSRWRWLLVPVWIGFLAATSPAASANPPSPNIAVILTDDLGFTDPGCFGSEIAATQSVFYED